MVSFTMNHPFIFAVVFIGLFCSIIYSLYASLIKKRNKYEEALSSIDVQLKKRYDLIPNILTIAQKFMDHESELMKEVTQLRVEVLQLGKKDFDKVIKIDNELANKMGQIFASFENYPQLKSDAAMVTAMTTYNEVEEHIAAARRFYNAAAAELKNAVEIFPSSYIAKKLNIETPEFIEITKAEKRPINVNDYLK